MTDKDPNRNYTLEDLLSATRELTYARSTLADKKNVLKRYRDAIKSLEKDESDAEAEVARRETTVKKIAGNLAK